MGMKVVDLRPPPACSRTYRMFLSLFAKVFIICQKNEKMAFKHKISKFQIGKTAVKPLKISLEWCCLYPSTCDVHRCLAIQLHFRKPLHVDRITPAFVSELSAKMQHKLEWIRGAVISFIRICLPFSRFETAIPPVYGFDLVPSAKKVFLIWREIRGESQVCEKEEGVSKIIVFHSSSCIYYKISVSSHEWEF